MAEFNIDELRTMTSGRKMRDKLVELFELINQIASSGGIDPEVKAAYEEMQTIIGATDNDGLRKKAITLETNYSNLMNRYSTLSGEYTSLNNRITALENRMDIIYPETNTD